MQTLIDISKIGAFSDSNITNPCVESGCPAACCRFPVFSHVTQEEFDYFLKADGRYIPARKFDTIDSFNNALTNYDPRLYGNVSVLYYKTDHLTNPEYHMAVVGINTNGYCPNLDLGTMMCKIYELRPEECRGFKREACSAKKQEQLNLKQ